MNAFGEIPAKAVSARAKGNGTKARTQAERRGEAERRMLDAAAHLIAEKGFAGLTLNEVGEAAGYSRGLPAHYFGTKDVLIGAIAKHIIERFGRRLDQENLAHGLDAILRSADFYLKSAAKDPMTVRALFIVLTEATSNPDLFPGVADVNRNSVEAFARDIKAGQKIGEIHADVHPKSQAVLILGQLRGVVEQWLVDPEAFNIDRVRAEFILSLKRSLTS